MYCAAVIVTAAVLKGKRVRKKEFELGVRCGFEKWQKWTLE